MIYRFYGRATGAGHYYSRWDLAQNIEVLAKSREEATAKAFRMLGDHPSFATSTHCGWRVVWDRVAEEKE